MTANASTSPRTDKANGTFLWFQMRIILNKIQKIKSYHIYYIYMYI